MKRVRSRAGRIVAAATAATVALTLAGCSGDSASGGDPSKLTIAMDSDPAAFGYDPLEYSTRQQVFFEGFYESLAKTNPDGSVAPGLATEFIYNEEGTVLTMPLAEGIEFADGSTLDAELVKANLDRRDDPELPAYAAFAPGEPTEIVSVDVVDDMTVSLTFGSPQQGFEANLASIAGMIVGSEGIEDPSTLAQAPDGSGPFSLADGTVKGSEYVLEKKEEHPSGDDYAFETIVFKPIADPQARTNAVISGQADTAFIHNSTVELARSKGLGISQIGGTVVSLLVFDKTGATNQAFADERVRLALSHAIDRDSFVEAVHPGEIPAVNALPQENPGFDESIDEEFGYDPEKAKQLLADAGYEDGLTIQIVTDPNSVTDWEALQQYFSAVGVTLDVKVGSSSEEIFGAVRTTPLGMLPLNWGNAPGTMFGVILGFANPHGAQNPELLAATQAVAGNPTPETLGALNRELVSSGWLIPVYEQVTTWASNDHIAWVTFPGQFDVPLLSSFKPAT
ncbi:ABC transporter substrate-binding protein [Salinibacterium sp. SYSU T00001]|uniref:ABC transporter substrate-binding protein n=1 Tax=Homoserinimonas sedimenticola TaxID=2986805 RepID=UPI002235F26A|nr:ABC transporter substrate-binding protein [Salinibacterium sedimenticola]MCW4386227.1 ABC transporter substrate-binding protein [Salinibacterium sedimenticola]